MNIMVKTFAHRGGPPRYLPPIRQGATGEDDQSDITKRKSPRFAGSSRTRRGSLRPGRQLKPLPQLGPVIRQLSHRGKHIFGISLMHRQVQYHFRQHYHTSSLVMHVVISQQAEAPLKDLHCSIRSWPGRRRDREPLTARTSTIT